MLDVALFVQDNVLAHQLGYTLEGMGAKVARYGMLSDDSTLWRSRHLDLMVVHFTPTVMDLASTFMPEQCAAQRVASLALVPDHHMAFAPDLLDAGFDRCLPVSWDSAIFCAEVRALTRRRQGMTASVCHYGALSFNHATQQACVAGVVLDLTPREAQVLDILLKRVGQIIPKERLLQDIAPDNMAINTTAAEVYIHRLRKKISHDLLPVRNIKRCGYLLPRYVDPSDSALCQAELSKPIVSSVWPRYELVGNHLAI
jgi:DNA-binding response OmpR family regulator